MLIIQDTGHYKMMCCCCSGHGWQPGVWFPHWPRRHSPGVLQNVASLGMTLQHQGVTETPVLCVACHCSPDGCRDFTTDCPAGLPQSDAGAAGGSDLQAQHSAAHSGTTHQEAIGADR